MNPRAEQNRKLNDLLSKHDDNETLELAESLVKYIQETREKGSYSQRNYFLINPMVIN